MIENKPSETPTTIDYFERLPLKQKMEAFENIVCAVSDHLMGFKDPVLTHELDVLDAIQNNIATRLEEIKTIYGQE